MSTPREQLAELLRQTRIDAGYVSQGALARRLKVSRPVINKAENATQPVPSDTILTAWSGATGVPLDQLTDLAARCKSGAPEWFMPYRQAEAQATLIRCWAPIIVPGLLQHETYARAVLTAEPHTPEQLDMLVATRMERQQVLNRAHIIAVLDASVLSRYIGSPAVMAEQCRYLRLLAQNANISVHIVPEGTNTGAWAALDIATRGTTATICLTTALEDVTTSASEQVDAAMQTFERIALAALPAVTSLEFIQQQEDQWRARLLPETGERLATAQTVALTAWKSLATLTLWFATRLIATGEPSRSRLARGRGS